jgi:hypothetical protein
MSPMRRQAFRSLMCPVRSTKRREKFACPIDRRCGRAVMVCALITNLYKERTRGTRLKTRGSDES